MKRSVKYLIFCCFIFQNIQAQLTLHILDEQDIPLSDAYILMLPDSIQKTTNANGEAFFYNLEKKLYQFKIQYLGYQTKEITIKNTGNERHIDIRLEISKTEIDEIIIKDHHNHQEEVLSSIHLKFDEIQTLSMPTFAKTLEMIPGVSSINVGVGISKPVIRGLFGNRVIVNHHYIKQEGQQWGTDHGLEIDPFDVGEVEIIKGPASLQYGSDGLGGVINILPNKLPKMNTISTEVNTVYRSNNHHAGISAKLGVNYEGWFFTGRYTHQNWGDFVVPQDTFIYNTFQLPIFNNTLKNTAGRENHLSLSAGKSGEKGMLRFSYFLYDQQAGIFPGAMGIPRSFTLQDDGDNRNIDFPSQDTKHHKTVMNAKWYLNENWELYINAAHQMNIRKEFSFPEFHRRLDADRDDTKALQLNLQTFTLNAHADHDFSERWKNVYGFDVQYQINERGGWDFLLPDFNTFRGGAYFIADFKANSTLDINGGARIDIANNINDDFTQYIFNSNGFISDSLTVEALDNWFYNFSASLGVNKKFSERWTYRTNFGKSFRVPYPNETSSNGVHHGTFRHEQGDPDLRTEHGYQLDISADYQVTNMIFSGAVFANYFDNFIYLRPSARFSTLPEAGQLFNYTQSNAFFSGFEFDWSWNFHKNFTWRKTAEYVWNVNLDNRLPLPFTPPASISNELTYHLKDISRAIKGFKTSAYYKYGFAQNRVDRNELQTPDFHFLSVEIMLSTLLNGNELDISFQAQNLLNAQYFNHLSRYRLLNIPEQGINFVVQLKYRLVKALK